jgi:hypothetical protein
MPLPLIPLAAAGLFGSIATAGVLTNGFTSKYEEEFDYDYYDKSNKRFYNPKLVSMLNPTGFDEELYIEAMDEFGRLEPLN